ncbi:MAG: hypothetical protein HC842_05075 [Cytophagales bacterium]|nr:hypothetical protein [Cytophagales bacterium]
MKMICLLLTLCSLVVSAVADVGQANKYKKQAEQAFAKGQYDQAISAYHQLLDTLHIPDERARLNLSHAYFHNQDMAAAARNYSLLTHAKDAAVRSVAFQQMGLIAFQAQKHKEALGAFKQSLKANPANEDARYNYELVKRLLQENPEQDQNQSDQNQEDQQDNQNEQSQKNKENKGKQGDNGDKADQQQDENEQSKEQENQQAQDQKNGKDQPGEQSRQSDEKSKEEPEQDDKALGNTQEQADEKEEQRQQEITRRLMEMNMSPEKAQMILEAMRNSEMQYLQQMKRKGKTPKDGKPDW